MASASCRSLLSLSLKPSWPKSAALNRPAKLTGPSASGMSVSSVVRVGTVTALAVMDGPSSSKIIFEPTSALAVDTCRSMKPPMSKSAWSFPLAVTAAPFSTSTRLWSWLVVYSILWPAFTPVMVATPAEKLMTMAGSFTEPFEFSMICPALFLTITLSIAIEASLP